MQVIAKLSTTGALQNVSSKRLVGGGPLSVNCKSEFASLTEILDDSSL
jgi:hypothetical protein